MEYADGERALPLPWYVFSLPVTLHEKVLA